MHKPEEDVMYISKYITQSLLIPFTDQTCKLIKNAVISICFYKLCSIQLQEATFPV